MLKNIVLSFTLALFALDALGHALWNPDGPTPPRNNRNDLKAGPCGGVSRTDSPSYLQSGSSLTVEIQSVIFHQGYYRILFSPENDENFESNVLADNIPDVQGQTLFQVPITLPDIQCDGCTLLVIQVMEDRSPPTNYFSCADIVLNATGLPDSTPNDTTAPGNAEFGQNNASASSTSLNWINPNDSDFFRSLILRSPAIHTKSPHTDTEYSVGATIGNGTVVYNGSGTNFTDNGLTADTSYYYKIFSYDNALNYASGVETIIATGDSNSSPVISFTIEQNSRLGTQVIAEDGLVVVQTTVTDADTNDIHSFDWSGTDSSLSDNDNNQASFTFDPNFLNDGQYQVSVLVSDDGTPPLSTSASVSIQVQTASTPSPTPSSTPAARQAGGGGVLGIGLFGLLLSIALLSRRIKY